MLAGLKADEKTPRKIRIVTNTENEWISPENIEVQLHKMQAKAIRRTRLVLSEYMPAKILMTPSDIK